MPWQENSTMDSRLRFIADYLSGDWTMSGLCHHHGVSRKTGYKWLLRYEQEGAAGLHEKSRAPKQHGLATPSALADKIIAMRQARPSWGPVKIIAKLKLDHPDLDWPAASTAGELLKRAGLVTGRRVIRRAPPRLGELTQPERPSHVWNVDHKGWVRLGGKTRCEPLTMTDGYSRYLLTLAATASTREEEARPLFLRAVAEYGLPEVIRSDNGPPFASAGVTGLTQLSVWWTKLGIMHARIDPGEPQQNGRHERFHLTLLEAMQPVAPNRTAQDKRFRAFARDYNEERPHQALNDLPPARFYEASPRKLPKKIEEPDYSPETAVRKVRTNGEIKWHGNLIHISSALIGEAAGIDEIADGDFLVRFYKHPLGIIERNGATLKRIKKMPRTDRIDRQ